MDVKALSATAAPSAFEFCQDPGRAKDEWSGRKVSLGKAGDGVKEMRSSKKEETSEESEGGSGATLSF